VDRGLCESEAIGSSEFSQCGPGFFIILKMSRLSRPSDISQGPIINFVAQVVHEPSLSLSTATGLRSRVCGLF
jgi:hypothetical protein